jgi:putative hydrolase of the HAD superfamily
MIVFDLDDTLYKERDFLASGRSAVARHFAASLGVDPDRLLSEMLAAKDPFDYLVEISNGAISIGDILNIYRNHMPDISLDKDVEKTLSTLVQRGVPLAIITDGRSVTQRNKIAALGLERYVSRDAIIISEEIGAEKTEPKPFVELMQRFPDAAPYTYVGDNPAKDFTHPRHLGWHTVMLADAGGINIHPQHVNPDFPPHTIISSLTELIC